jgi:hypothetical protein
MVQCGNVRFVLYVRFPACGVIYLTNIRYVRIVLLTRLGERGILLPVIKYRKILTTRR